MTILARRLAVEPFRTGTSPGEPTGAEPGLVMNSDSQSAASLAGVALGPAQVVRVEYVIGESATTIGNDAAFWVSKGARLHPSAGFHGRLPSEAEAKNLRSWAEAGAPHGVKHVEFGNETNYQIANTKANGEEYGHFARIAAEGLAASGTGVTLLAQGSDAGSGKPEWLDGIFTAVPDITSRIGGWTIHAYPGLPEYKTSGMADTWGIPMMERMVKRLEEHGDTTTPIYNTEWGVPTTESGRTMTSGQSMTWDEGRKVLEWHRPLLEAAAKGRLVQLMLYQAHDQAADTGQTNRELFFGAVNSAGGLKASFTTYVEDFLRGTAPARHRLKLGAALNYAGVVEGTHGPLYVPTFNAHYDYWTPEQELKLATILAGNAQPSAVDLTKVLAMYAQTPGKRMRGHSFLWYHENPFWVVNWAGSAAAMRTAMEGFARELAQQLAAKVPLLDRFDVINEPSGGGTGKLEAGDWTRIFGSAEISTSSPTMQFIAGVLKAFHEGNPSLLLVANESGIEKGSQNGAGTRGGTFLKFVETLLALGAPLHGVGFECHDSNTFFPTSAELESVWAKYEALGLFCEVTELDLEIQSGGTRVQQKAAAEAIAGAAVAKSTSTVLTTWGFTDASSWLGSAAEPLPWDTAYNQKPFWEALQTARNVT